MATRQLKIGIDLDGVCADFTHCYRGELIEFQCGNPTSDWNPKKDPNKWHWEKDYGFTQQAVDKFWQTTAHDYAFWRNLPILLSQDDHNLLTGLYAYYEVYFITHRPHGQRQASIDWIEARLGLRNPTVLLSGNKGAIADGLGLDMIFDDKPDNLVDVKRACGSRCAAYLISQPWNSQFSHPYIRRVASLREGIKAYGCE